MLGIGTILVYVSANVILLENHPETSLPIAYMLSAIALFGVGKIYEYFEHHLLLKKLATTVLIAIIVLVFLVILTLFVSHTVAIAVGIMVSYRVIYLLGNLEFWGISALAFDVRQSKRLFSSIGSGDMPAKAIGAILAALIHSSAVLLILLAISLVAFFLAFLTQRLTFKEVQLPDPHHSKTRKNKITASKLVQQLFGGNVLVFQLCLCVLAVAAAATWIEYHFFVNVKYKFHSQHDVLGFIGYLLMATYLIATIIKFLFSGRAIERYGVKYAIYLLPATTALISFGLVVSSFLYRDETSLLVDYCVAYICFEVARRTIFDPVFLVLFQPLSIQTRLKGHTLAKGFYEPLGMGFAGIVLWLTAQMGGLAVWGAFVFTMACAIAAMFFVKHAYNHYVAELKSAIGKRFIKEDDLVFQGEALKIILKKLHSPEEIEVLYAIDWLARHQPEKLHRHFNELLKNPSVNVRQELLKAGLGQSIHLSNIEKFIQNEPDFECRALATEAICSNLSLSETMAKKIFQTTDLAVMKGALRANLNLEKNAKKENQLVHDKLSELLNVENYDMNLLGLETLRDYPNPLHHQAIFKYLKNNDITIQKLAIEAASATKSNELLGEIVSLIQTKKLTQKCLTALVESGDEGIGLLRNSADGLRLSALQKTVRLIGKYPSKTGENWLFELAESPYFLHRKMAFKSMLNHTDLTHHKPFFDNLIQQEIIHIQQLLGGYTKQEISTDAFDYELKEAMQRLFYLFMLLYDTGAIKDAASGLDSDLKEKKANALETLEHILPRHLYLLINVLISDSEPVKKKAVLGSYLGQAEPNISFQEYVLSHGERRFGSWTVVNTLQNWHQTQSDFTLILPYLTHSNSLFQEASWAALELSSRKIELLAHIDENTILMKHKHANSSQISGIERIIVLKNTQLFAQTPENVLSSIAPIMKELHYTSGQMIFEKGELGNCMYVVYSGEVGIYDGENQLTIFGKGDIFGELALLDAEPRSASAIAESDVLIFRIDQDDFSDLMNERDEILRSILTILCQRIRHQNSRLREVSK